MTQSPAADPSLRDPLQPVLADLELIQQTDLPGQVEIYERMHTALAGALATTVDQPGPGGSR
jgi:hypothetical protein